jgi:hypothetical protein
MVSLYVRVRVNSFMPQSLFARCPNNNIHIKKPVRRPCLSLISTITKSDYSPFGSKSQGSTPQLIYKEWPRGENNSIPTTSMFKYQLGILASRSKRPVAFAHVPVDP